MKVKIEVGCQNGSKAKVHFVDSERLKHLYGLFHIDEKDTDLLHDHIIVITPLEDETPTIETIVKQLIKKIEEEVKVKC